MAEIVIPSFNIDDLYSVAGTTVVVTGGGSGLGRAIATAYATNGAKVIICGRRQEVLDRTVADITKLAAKGGSITGITADVSSKPGVKAFYDEVTKVTDVVDVLVNCAGIMRSYKNPTTDVNDIDAVAKMLWDGHEDEDFNSTNQVNINGVYWTTVAFVPLLMKSKLRSVVVIASIAGLILQRAVGSVSYGASKAAALHVANMLAGRLSPGKIRVNTICPGIFPSEMTGTSGTDGKYDVFDAPTKAAARAPMGRPGHPHEIVGPVLLLGSRAGSYMDGACLVVDGGRSMGAGIQDGIRLPDNLYVA